MDRCSRDLLLVMFYLKNLKQFNTILFFNEFCEIVDVLILILRRDPRLEFSFYEKITKAARSRLTQLITRSKTNCEQTILNTTAHQFR